MEVHMRQSYSPLSSAPTRSSDPPHYEKGGWTMKTHGYIGYFLFGYLGTTAN